jgi:hypothetical protein
MMSTRTPVKAEIRSFGKFPPEGGESGVVQFVVESTVVGRHPKLLKYLHLETIPLPLQTLETTTLHPDQTHHASIHGR